MIVLADLEGARENLVRMVDQFRSSVTGNVEVVPLEEVNIKSGCIGCCHCAYDNTCIQGSNDGYVWFYNSRLKTADMIVLAGTIHDRYLSSRWKAFFDRSFFNTHRPTLAGKQVAFVICGPLRQLPNLRQILQAHVEMQGANLAGFVTDECADSAELDAQIRGLAGRLVRFAHTGYVAPQTFLGVGGWKIFRDDIWGWMRFPFKADHKFYKANGLYDFPQRDWRSRIRNAFLNLLIMVPAIRKSIYKDQLRDRMIEPYQKLLAE
jgi:multimeric flavodoxin WrbA